MYNRYQWRTDLGSYSGLAFRFERRTRRWTAILWETIDPGPSDPRRQSLLPIYPNNNKSANIRFYLQKKSTTKLLSDHSFLYRLYKCLTQRSEVETIFCEKFKGVTSVAIDKFQEYMNAQRDKRLNEVLHPKISSELTMRIVADCQSGQSSSGVFNTPWTIAVWCDYDLLKIETLHRDNR